MTSPDRPEPPAEAVCPRLVADSVGDGLKSRVKPSAGGYGREIVDEVHDVLRTHVEGPCELGPYIEDEDLSAGGRLDGNPRPIWFDGPWWAWFRRLTPELRRNLLWLANQLNSPERRHAFAQLLDAQVKRNAMSDFWRSVRKAVLWGVVSGAAGLAWLSDQISHFVEKWPSLKSFWDIIMGPPK